MNLKSFILCLLVGWSFAHAQTSSVEQINQLLTEHRAGAAIERLDEEIKSTPQDEQAVFWLLRAEAYAFLAGQETEGYEDPYIEAGLSLQKAINGSDTQPAISTKAIHLRDSLYQHLVSTGLATEDPEAGLLQFSYAQFISPDDTLAYLKAAALAEKLEFWQIALFNYERLLPLGIQSPAPVLSMVNLTLSHSKDTTMALKYASQGFKQVMYSDSLHRLLNRILILTDQSEAAKKQLRASIYEAPENFDNYFNMAMLLEVEGRGEEANSYYLTATQRDSNDVRAWKNWGTFYWKEAKRMYRDYFFLPEETPDEIRQELKIAYEQHFRLTLPLLEKANSLQPHHIPTLEKLEALYTMLDMNEKRLKMFQEILELESD